MIFWACLMGFFHYCRLTRTKMNYQTFVKKSVCVLSSDFFGQTVLQNWFNPIPSRAMYCKLVHCTCSACINVWSLLHHPSTGAPHATSFSLLAAIWNSIPNHVYQASWLLGCVWAVTSETRVWSACITLMVNNVLLCHGEFAFANPRARSHAAPAFLCLGEYFARTHYALMNLAHLVLITILQKETVQLQMVPCAWKTYFLGKAIIQKYPENIKLHVILNNFGLTFKMNACKVFCGL